LNTLLFQLLRSASEAVGRLTQVITVGVAALLFQNGAAALVTVFLGGSAAASEALPQITTRHGVPTLEVDGAPFLVVGAQCDVWRGLRQDRQTVAFFEGYQAMNATTVAVDVPWSKIELTEDRYDFQFLDWFIAQAQQHGLKLVVDLFNSNVCGKVREGNQPGQDPVYPPAYILDAPEKYQRMVLPGSGKYHPGGPPMCPNDPRTLERERRLCRRVAAHLAQTDQAHTVIMLQIDNEFYYQQWLKAPSTEATEVRCHCRFCEEKWAAGSWKNGEDFMFHSFAHYVAELTHAITVVYPLPCYVNSPWWPPREIPAFLDNCPDLALVGIDGVFAPNEPNIFSESQIGRNRPFAAENPTENPKTRMNLDVLPYYTVVGCQGIGNLLWECGPPFTIVDDPSARERYGAALYPLRWAQTPIARARGTEDLLGWYTVRDVSTSVTTDVFGNFISTVSNAAVVTGNHLFIREGTHTRLTEATAFTATLGGLQFTISNSVAGIIVRSNPRTWVIAVPHGRITITGSPKVRISEGRYHASRWQPAGVLNADMENGARVLTIDHPEVLQLTVDHRP
jgi:hypothetical protein